MVDDMIKLIDNVIEENDANGLNTKLLITFKFFGVSFYMLTNADNLSVDSREKYITINEDYNDRSTFNIDVPIDNNLKIIRKENGFDIFNSGVMDDCIHCELLPKKE